MDKDIKVTEEKNGDGRFLQDREETEFMLCDEVNTPACSRSHYLKHTHTYTYTHTRSNTYLPLMLRCTQSRLHTYTLTQRFSSGSDLRGEVTVQKHTHT